MKGLLNVLYRRILYKIPLKFLLLVLVIILGFISFSEASQFFAYTKSNANSSNKSDLAWIFDIGVNYTQYITVDKNGFSGSIKILVQSNFNCSPGNILIYDGGQYSRYPLRYESSGKLCITDEIVLSDSSSFQFFYSSTQNSSANDVQFIMVDLDSFNNSVKPYSTGFIASVSIPTICPTINSEYCINNDLCPICPTINKSFCKSEYGLIEPSECPISGGGTGDISWSALYINNIQHIGGPNIYINIPEEIGRDYDYINDDMYINVFGYNVDYDKITGIINTQNYKPTTEDFNYIISSVIPLFVPGLVIILFLYWIFKFIKKIF